MSTLHRRALIPRPADRTRWVRSALALVYVIGLTIFLIWFIATHLAGYGD